MAWNTSGYEDFAAQFVGIENPLAVEVQVDPTTNGGANILCVHTGTVILGRLMRGLEEVRPSGGNWLRGLIRFPIPSSRRWTFAPLPPEPIPAETPLTYLFSGAVMASLASIFNRNVATNAGWAVDGADLFAVGHKDEGLRVEAKLAVRDSDGFLHRIAYQATALGKAPRDPVVIG